MYKANFDAAFFDGIGMAGLGVVVRDYMGNIIAAFSHKIRGPHSVEMAEALACSRASMAEALHLLFKISVCSKWCLREIAFGLYRL